MAGDSAEQSWWLVSAALLAGLALFLGVMVVWHPVIACVQSKPEAVMDEGDPSEIQAELEAWETMWDDIEEGGVEALGPDVHVAGARYAGDTCGMRYRRLYRRIDRETREHLVIAAFANDPETKERILKSLLDSPDPRIRGRTVTELARVALRQGDAAAAEAALRGSVGLELPEACEADLHYLQGRIALMQREDAGAALHYFALANARDPGYWNAYRDQLPLLVQFLHEPDQGTAACLRHARRLIEVLGLLPQLADDTRQFAKLALSLERLGAHSSATLLATGLTWRWAGQEAYGRSILARAMQAPDVLPRECESAMRARIAVELEAS